MKKNYFLIAILFFNCIILNAQSEDVLDPFGSGVTGFLLVGNDLYYTQSSDISKIDITASTPSPVTIVTGLSEPTGLLLHGNDLYFSQATADKVSKIDITSGSPTIVDVVAGVSEPSFLALKGNDLYIAETSGGKISKIDITASLPTTATQVVSGLNVPLDLELIGNDLYIVEVEANKILKIDISLASPAIVEVATGFNKPLHLALNGDDLYISETDGSKISKIDITASLPATVSNVLIGLNRPEVLASNATDLYYSANSSAFAGQNKIAKINYLTLTTEEGFATETIKLYPNPTTDHISVSELRSRQDYDIFDAAGKKILEGTVLSDNNIDVSFLESGMYFLKFDDSTSMKFIKE